jgi:hypothetical protein
MDRDLKLTTHARPTRADMLAFVASGRQRPELRAAICVSDRDRTAAICVSDRDRTAAICVSDRDRTAAICVSDRDRTAAICVSDRGGRS